MIKTLTPSDALRVRAALEALDNEPNFSDFDASPNFSLFRELCELLNVRYPYDSQEDGSLVTYGDLLYELHAAAETA